MDKLIWQIYLLGLADRFRDALEALTILFTGSLLIMLLVYFIYLMEPVAGLSVRRIKRMIWWSAGLMALTICLLVCVPDSRSLTAMRVAAAVEGNEDVLRLLKDNLKSLGFMTEKRLRELSNDE